MFLISGTDSSAPSNKTASLFPVLLSCCNLPKLPVASQGTFSFTICSDTTKTRELWEESVNLGDLLDNFMPIKEASSILLSLHNILSVFWRHRGIKGASQVVLVPFIYHEIWSGIYSNPVVWAWLMIDWLIFNFEVLIVSAIIHLSLLLPKVQGGMWR